MRESLEGMYNFLDNEIFEMEPHTVAWYRIYGLHTSINDALESLKLVENEVLGNHQAYEYSKEIDIRERLNKE